MVPVPLPYNINRLWLDLGGTIPPLVTWNLVYSILTRSLPKGFFSIPYQKYIYSLVPNVFIIYKYVIVGSQNFQDKNKVNSKNMIPKLGKVK